MNFMGGKDDGGRREYFPCFAVKCEDDRSRQEKNHLFHFMIMQRYETSGFDPLFPNGRFVGLDLIPYQDPSLDTWHVV